MKLTTLNGIYLTYRGSGIPTLTLERQVYAFRPENERTVLVTIPRHVSELLRQYPLEVTGVEVPDPPSTPPADSAKKTGGRRHG